MTGGMERGTYKTSLDVTQCLRLMWFEGEGEEEGLYNISRECTVFFVNKSNGLLQNRF